MKIPTIYHSIHDRRKERKGDATLKRYTKDPAHHPLLLEREYVRALNATKLDRLFAKPFITALCANSEGITHLVKDPESSLFATASYDSNASLWDLDTRAVVSSRRYSLPISGIAMDRERGVYVAQEKSVFKNDFEYRIGSTVAGLDYSTFSAGAGDLAVACADGVKIFDVERAAPRTVYSCRDVSAVRFNHSLKHLMAGIRTMSVELFDNRSCKPFTTIDVSGATCAEFNPQQGHILGMGNEDGNAYTYDIRELSKPLGIYRGHTNAVVSMAFNPNGTEIATGSYDRTVRIFRVQERKSRDCYYNERMHLVHGVAYSNDGRFIITGSDDGSLRLWKADASKKVSPISKREREAAEYKEALKEKFKDVGDVARISRHRFLPKELKQASREKHEMYEARLRREEKRAKEEEERNGKQDSSD